MQSADEAITELRVKIRKLGESKKLHEIELAELTQEVEDNRKRRETDAIETALYGEPLTRMLEEDEDRHIHSQNAKTDSLYPVFYTFALFIYSET
jgi:hypothetical protein